MANVNHLYNKFSESDITLSYLGHFNDEITDKLIGISEFYLENKTELGKLKNKVSFLIAECFQNIVRHKDTSENLINTNTSGTDFFQMNVLKDRTVITSCNLIDTNNVKGLESKLIQVNSLDAEGLKKLYNEVLSSEGFSEKGGAGLGLIEMARKSGLPLKYHFLPYNDNYNLFFLTLEIVNKKGEIEEKVSMKDIIDSYKEFTNDKVIMFYKGDLSRAIIVPIVEMFQNNLSAGKDIEGKEKRGLITLIEALQNVSKHGKSFEGLKEGAFTIKKDDNQFSIETGNFVETDKENQLSAELKHIKELNKDEIKALYKNRLLNNEISAEGNCGLGLLEIARNSENRFEYSFAKNETKGLFYSLKVTI